MKFYDAKRKLNEKDCSNFLFFVVVTPPKLNFILDFNGVCDWPVADWKRLAQNMNNRNLPYLGMKMLHQVEGHNLDSQKY